VADTPLETTLVLTQSDEPPHPERIDAYEVVKVLGKGGMGTVYLAKDHALDRLVAIKMLLPFAADAHKDERKQLIMRFLREAKAIARLNHRNIVSIYGIGKESGSIYIAMEYVDGHTLTELIRTAPQLSFSQKIGYMIQIAEGLAVIHRAGFIHRDIKPGNIMLTNDDVIKIMDFGTVQTTESDLTRAEQIIGTPSYMSPEQIQGHSTDPRSDIFALGSVFYQFLTGEKPFFGESFSSVSYKITHEAPSPPSKLNPLLPKAVDRVILKMLAKSPDARYQTCEELAEDLRALLTRQRPVGQTVRRGMLVALGVSFVLTVALAGYLLFGTGGELDPGRIWRQVLELSGLAGTRGTQVPVTAPSPFRAHARPLSLEYTVAYQPAGSSEIRRLRNLETLSSHDRFRVIFSPQESCFVHVFRVDNGVEVIPLYPLRMDNPVPAGARIVLPDGPEPYSLENVSGEQQIVALASVSRNIDLGTKTKVLLESQHSGNIKLLQIYRFKLRMAFNKTEMETKDTAQTASIPWDAGGSGYTYAVRRVDNLCDECVLRVTFTVTP